MSMKLVPVSKRPMRALERPADVEFRSKNPVRTTPGYASCWWILFRRIFSFQCFPRFIVCSLITCIGEPPFVSLVRKILVRRPNGFLTMSSSQSLNDPLLVYSVKAGPLSADIVLSMSSAQVLSWPSLRYLTIAPRTDEQSDSLILTSLVPDELQTKTIIQWTFNEYAECRIEVRSICKEIGSITVCSLASFIKGTSRRVEFDCHFNKRPVKSRVVLRCFLL